MSDYVPSGLPTMGGLLQFLSTELQKIASCVRADSPTVLYRTLPANQGSLTAGVSANYKLAYGNVVRVSSSATVTLTGIAYKIANREIALINVGTGVVVKDAATESSASYRFALVNSIDLSQNAAAVLWYDGLSARWRVLSKT
jgi:protein involved in polysaccharide export with SLBB domain